MGVQTPEKYGSAPQLSDLNSRELQATMDLICVFLWKVLNLLGFFLARDNNYLRLQEMYPLSQMYKRAMDCSWLRLLKSCYHTQTLCSSQLQSAHWLLFHSYRVLSNRFSLTDTALITRNIVSYTCRKHIASSNIPEQTELELCCFLLLIAFWVFLSSNDVPCCCSPTIFGSSQNSCGLPIVIGTITIITE